MSVGVYDYLAWRPTELERAAHWFAENSRLADRIARTVRDGVDRGTEAQWGEFIESVRDDGDTVARRIDELADLMLEASTMLTRVGAELSSAVGSLRGLVAEADTRGFVVLADGGVRDGSSAVMNDEDRSSRREKATELRDRIGDVLVLIRRTDEEANRALHDLVGRDVRDRTDAGNTDPMSTYAAGAIDLKTGLVEMNMEKMIAAGELPQLDGKWWNSARGLGLFGNLVGFVGNVAAAPEGEPWYETLVAEGAGVVGGTIGSTTMPFIAGLFGGKAPTSKLLSGVAGGGVGSLWASSEVREAFDRAN